MSKLEKIIVENGIEYILIGDYYFPNLLPPKEDRPIGKYGRILREYLKEHRKEFFSSLVISGKVFTYLADLNERAEQRLATIMEQMKRQEGVTEELKATDQMKWVRCMNSIKNRAEEIVLHEMVYCNEWC